MTTAKKPTKTAKAAPKKATTTASSAFMKPLKLSKDLQAVLGKDPLPRTQVTKKIWEYIKTNELQNPANKKEIIADAKLEKVFGKDKVDMFEMTKILSTHLTK